MTAGDRQVVIVGGGPAGLMAAEALSGVSRNRVSVFDCMPTVGRKFLMAGRGGLNLTHSEPLEAFIARYGARADAMRPLLEAWTPDEVRAWCEGLGRETFIGTSGRVFPREMKASGVLRAWLRRLIAQGVTIRTRHRWTGWDDAGRLQFATSDGVLQVESDATVLALGGGSWPRLGSTGNWTDILARLGVATTPLEPSNCGVRVAWSDIFRERFEGQPLKGIAVSHGSSITRGEAIVTRSGLEGGAIYELSAVVRQTLHEDGAARLVIDLKPQMDGDALATRLAKPRGKQSVANFLRKAAGLASVEIGLLQEIAHARGEYLGGLGAHALAGAIKRLPVAVIGMAGIERAISTAGGVDFDEVDEHLMLRRRPGVFIAGEMLDWEAPTGGYLLQGAFATGVAAARGVGAWLGEQHSGGPSTLVRH